MKKLTLTLLTCALSSSAHAQYLDYCEGPAAYSGGLNATPVEVECGPIGGSDTLTFNNDVAASVGYNWKRARRFSAHAKNDACSSNFSWVGTVASHPTETFEYRYVAATHHNVKGVMADGVVDFVGIVDFETYIGRDPTTGEDQWLRTDTSVATWYLLFNGYQPNMPFGFTGIYHRMLIHPNAFTCRPTGNPGPFTCNCQLDFLITPATVP